MGASAVVTLAHFCCDALIPQFLRFIIGLHFLRLAWILKAPRHYVLETIKIVWALGSLLIPEGRIRNFIACAETGLPMWITAVVTSSQD